MADDQVIGAAGQQLLGTRHGFDPRRWQGCNIGDEIVAGTGDQRHRRGTATGRFDGAQRAPVIAATGIGDQCAIGETTGDESGRGELAFEVADEQAAAIAIACTIKPVTVIGIDLLHVQPPGIRLRQSRVLQFNRIQVDQVIVETGLPVGAERDRLRAVAELRQQHRQGLGPPAIEHGFAALAAVDAQDKVMVLSGAGPVGDTDQIGAEPGGKLGAGDRAGL